MMTMPSLKETREQTRKEPANPTSSCNVQNELLKKQFNRVKEELACLREMLKVNPKLTQIKLLMDSLEKELAAELGLPCSSPKLRATEY